MILNLSVIINRVKKKSPYFYKYQVAIPKPLAFNLNDSFCRMVNSVANARVDLPSNNGIPAPTPTPLEYSYIPVWE